MDAVRVGTAGGDALRAVSSLDGDFSSYCNCLFLLKISDHANRMNVRPKRNARPRRTSKLMRSEQMSERGERMVGEGFKSVR